MRYFALILFGTSCCSLFHGSSKITLIYCYFKCKYMKHIFELRMKDQIGERSSQLLRNCEFETYIFEADERSNRRKILAVVTQLKQLRKESLKKKFRLERDSNP